jgi:membrane protein YdbS with pleckstrin-like domain
MKGSAMDVPPVISRTKLRLLRFLRVTERPDPPPGSQPTLEMFRASERFFYLGAVGWLFKQAGALLGLLFSLALFGGGLEFLEIRMEGLEGVREWMDEVESVRVGPLEVEGDLFGLVRMLELFAVGVFVVQFFVGAALLRLAFEMRWYMVSDESLRIREGLWRIHEQTMTVANIQNMSVRQGPLQKLLGLADLEVRTAGGGGAGAEQGEAAGKAFHVGRFRGIENAEALRDRIRRALARHRDAGLGDPEDAHHDAHDQHEADGLATPAASPAAPGEARDDLLLVSEALRDEARSLHAAARAAFG